MEGGLDQDDVGINMGQQQSYTCGKERNKR